MSASYTVCAGDTLGAVARRNGTSVQELQRLNGLQDPDKIAVGQQLRLSTPSQLQPEASASEPWSQTVMRFLDAIGRPIAGLAVRLVADGKEIKAKTDAAGCVSAVTCDKPDTNIEIHVERAAHKGGGEKPIGRYTPMAGQQTVRVQSGKQVETTKIRRHEGAAQLPPKVMGHRMWLDEFVNGAITPSKFTCAGDRLDTFKNQEISGKLELIVKDLKQ